MRVDGGLAPLLAQLVELILVDVDDHRVATDTGVRNTGSFAGQTALGKFLDVLFRHPD